MEQSRALRLPPELQTIVDQFAKFRNEYSSLKAHRAAQEELISLQSLELEQMQCRADQLASTLLEYQKRFSTRLNNLESENHRLRKDIENLNREQENMQVQDKEYIVEVQRNNDEYSRGLEEKLNELRTEAALRDEKHEERIRSMEKRHSDEISEYKRKLEHVNLLEKRHCEEISSYRQKLEEMNSSRARDNAETSASKRTLDRTSVAVQESAASSGTSAEFAHPALSDDNGSRRKRIAPSSYRWPQLDVSTVKEAPEPQAASQSKKKRLYRADNDAIVDLEF